MRAGTIAFPEFSGLRCLMMPYIQGDLSSVPSEFSPYADILRSTFIQKGDIGYLTIDESPVVAGTPHRGDRAKYGRAVHTEVGKLPGSKLCHWGLSWGGKPNVLLEPRVEILLANNLDDSCAVWDAKHEDTSVDGDLGHVSHLYPYSAGIFMKAGEVFKIGVFTPHESLPVKQTFNRQFLRIVSSGVRGREEYFTENPLLPKFFE